MKCNRCEQEVGNSFKLSISEIPVCHKCWDELKRAERVNRHSIDLDPLSSDFGPFFSPGFLDL